MANNSNLALAIVLSIFSLMWAFGCSTEALPSATPRKTPTEVAEKKSRFIIQSVLDGMRAIDGNGRGTSLARSRSYARENLDILARAVNEISVNTASTLPPPRDELLDRFAVEGIVVDDYLGALNEADRYAKLLSSESTFDGIEYVPSVIKVLQAADRKKEAEDIEHRSSAAALNDFEPPNGVSQEQTLQAIRETVGQTRDCLDAIASGDKATAKSGADKLLRLYQSEEQLEQSALPWTICPQNLFCTVLNLARKFSDRGWYSESNTLLEKLKVAAVTKNDWSTALSFILIEQTVNGDRTKQNTGALWEKLDQEPLLDRDIGVRDKRLKYSFSKSEKLRLLGITFYKAGEFARADTLIARALKVYSDQDVSEEIGGHLLHISDEGVEGDRVMLMLSAACVKAAEHRFDQADEYIGQAFQGPPVEAFAYSARLAELARLYEENNRSAEAITFLRKARDIMAPVAFRMRIQSKSSPDVEYWLAKLLFDTGKPAEARSTIAGAIEQAIHPAQPPNTRDRIFPIRPEYYDYASFILAGDCAAAEKDYGAAALRYEEAGLSQQVGALFVREKPALEKFWLQKAKVFADKASNIASTDKARIYIELAKRVAIDSPQSAFYLNKTALALLPDTDDRKPSVLYDIAWQTERISAERNASSTPNSPNQSPITTSPHQLRDASFRLTRQAAETAEKSNDKTACGKYLELAGWESVFPDFLDQAVKDCEHAIRIYAGVPAYAYGTRSYNGPAPLNPSITAWNLLRHGRTADGIRLMDEAAAKVKSCNGLDSREAQEQLQVLMKFYSDSGMDEKALKSLDTLLESKMTPTPHRTVIICSSDAGFNMWPEYSWARIVAAKKPQLATTILSKVLEAQQKQLPSDDPKIADTYAALADVHSTMKDDTAALCDYQRAFEIKKLYLGEKAAADQIPTPYFDLLRKAGNNAEADRLDAVKNGVRDTSVKR